MGKKVALNVFYNIAIFACLAIVYTAWEHQRWEYVLGCSFLAAMFIIFKIKLIKEVRALQRKK
ncbi:DUF6358 family protein [Mucilaginibacter litoreus]|uniref:DUF6358 family protein n=1 Tax=Mucilaginibacter litoreus TaxID=1048221 RepID=A0ABW3AXP3_9SPHI